jgi:hypothetical protein
MTARLRDLAKTKSGGSALEHLLQILALSRNLRNKAGIESYLTGVEAEENALAGLDLWLAGGQPAPELRRALEELNRHAAQTPDPLDCLQTECYVSSGMLASASGWTFASGAPAGVGKVPERWLAGAIALSLETPWEAERATRLWQVVWSGLFRALQTPHWQLPRPVGELRTEKSTTGRILQGWLPASAGPGAPLTLERVTSFLDASWLSDERLFPPVTRLRAAATRARWRVDAGRQALALGLYQMQEGKPAQKLQDLVPKYFPKGLPTDPYSGQEYRYRISTGEDLGLAGKARPGQAIVWSTGPDQVDHGGRVHGGHLDDEDSRWSRGTFDLIRVVPPLAD